MKNINGKMFLGIFVLFSLTVIPHYIESQQVEIYPQLGPQMSALYITFSPDGRWLLSDSLGTAQIWDANTGREFRTKTGVTAQGWSPNGNICLGISENQIVLWDPMSGNNIRTIRHNNVKSAAFSPDGRRIVSCSTGDNLIKTWNVENGTELLSFRVSFRYMGSVKYSPDGRRIMVVSRMDENSVKIFDAETGREVRSILGDIWDADVARELLAASGTGATNAIFSPDGRTIIWAEFFDNESTVKIVDAETGRVQRVINVGVGAIPIGAIACSPDGRRIFTAINLGDNGFKIWDANTGRELRTIPDTFLVYTIAFSTDGRKIAYVGNGIKIIDAETYRELLTIRSPIKEPTVVCVTPNNRQIMIRISDSISLWSLETGRRTWTIPYSFLTPSVSPNGRYFAGVASTSDPERGANNISIYDTETGRQIRTWPNQRRITTGEIKWSPDSREITTFANTFVRTTLDIWNVENGRHVSGAIIGDESVSLLRIPRMVTSSNDHNRVAYLFEDSLQLWDIGSRGRLLTITGSFNTACWSVDSRQIATAGNNQLVTVWNRENGAKVWERQINSPINRISYSSNGRQIFAMSGNNISILNSANGNTVGSLNGHIKNVNSVVTSPDGKWIISSSDDRTTRIWNAETFTEIVKMVVYDDGEWVVITPDGYYTASARGEQYLNVRTGNTVSGVDRYRSTYNNPAVVQQRLTASGR